MLAGALDWFGVGQKPRRSAAIFGWCPGGVVLSICPGVRSSTCQRCMYRPCTDRTSPLSSDGDVREPTNIIWPIAHPDTYIRSLADAGIFDLAIYNA